MRPPRPVVFSNSSIPNINLLVVDSDDKASAFLAFWHRMHRTTCQLVAVALKYIEWSSDGASTNRCVWEVSQWPQGNTATWTFVCWLIDGQGMWLRQFASQEEAMAFFGRSPDVVMRPRDVAADDVAEGGRQRRAS